MTPTVEISSSDVPNTQSSKKRALVVDDSQDIADLFATILQTAGFEVTEAFSAYEALKTSRLETFDLVISDIGMPGMNGYELATALRAMPTYTKSILIAVTGFAQFSDKETALHAGFNEHIKKPIDPVALLNTLKRLGY
jgi:two-component system, chemotaxis family, CheB/CheR fusion protein